MSDCVGTGGVSKRKLLLLLSALMAGEGSSDVVGYYPFDVDFRDASGNGNALIAPGTTSVGPAITNAAGESRFGGGAIDFRSTTGDAEYLNLDTPLSFAAGDAWTLSFWARNRPGTDGRTGMIAGDLTNRNFIWIPGNGAVMGIRFRSGAGANADYDGIADDNEFHHWVVVADGGGGNVTIYRDNLSLGTRSLDTGFEITSIGQAFNQTTQSMNGQIDELYIFGDAIDAAAVGELFATNTPPEPALAPLLVHYPFDSDVADRSGNANDLTPVSTKGGGGSLLPTITNTEGEHQFGGGACDFDTTTADEAFLNFTTPFEFSSADPWSVVFWARHRPGNDGRAGMIVGDPSNAADFIWIPRDGVVDGVRFRNSSGENADYVTPPDGVEPAGVYHHFAVVADGTGNVEVYYDNVSLGSQVIDTSIGLVAVGQAFNATTQSMNGQIDELYVYDEAIDRAEIDRLFNGGGVGPAMEITDFDVVGDIITLRWNSIEGAEYAVRFSSDLVSWSGEFDDAVEADAGTETERSFDLEAFGLDDSIELFVRVERVVN